MLKVRAAVLSLVVLVPACASAFEWPLAIESARFPGVRIECAGEPRLTAEQCVAWAERILASRLPDRASEGGVGRLALTNRPGNSRCAADFYGRSGALLATAATVCPPR